ncbi:hypothetical protein ACQJBY_053872 [Aegilops geniculata]
MPPAPRQNRRPRRRPRARLRLALPPPAPPGASPPSTTSLDLATPATTGAHPPAVLVARSVGRIQRRPIFLVRPARRRPALSDSASPPHTASPPPSAPPPCPAAHRCPARPPDHRRPALLHHPHATQLLPCFFPLAVYEEGHQPLWARPLGSAPPMPPPCFASGHARAGGPTILLEWQSSTSRLSSPSSCWPWVSHSKLGDLPRPERRPALG